MKKVEAKKGKRKGGYCGGNTVLKLLLWPPGSACQTPLKIPHVTTLKHLKTVVGEIFPDKNLLYSALDRGREKTGLL